MSSVVDVNVKEFKQWLESRSKPILEPLKEQANKLVEKLQEKVRDSRETCERLDGEGRKQLEKGKTVRKAKLTEKLSKFFMKQIDKIKFPEKTSFAELKEFYHDLENNFSQMMREKNAWFPRISPLFIIARKRVDFAFGRFGSSIEEFDDFLSNDYSILENIEKMITDIDGMRLMIKRVNTHGVRVSSVLRKIENLQKITVETENKHVTIRSRMKLSNIEEVDLRVNELKRQLEDYFRHLKKPFIKFSNLKRSSEYALSSSEVEKLVQYIQDPFSALATEEEGYPLLRQILAKVERAIGAGRLKLKNTRVRKAREVINEITNQTSFNTTYEMCVKNYRLKRTIALSEEVKIAEEESKKLVREISELQRRKKAAETRLKILEENHDRLQVSLNRKKSNLEKGVFNLLQEKINLVF